MRSFFRGSETENISQCRVRCPQPRGWTLCASRLVACKNPCPLSYTWTYRMRPVCEIARMHRRRTHRERAGSASRLASAPSGEAVTAPPAAPAHGTSIALAGPRLQANERPQPALPALSASRRGRARAAARSRHAPSRGWRPAARSFVSAFAPVPAPRERMAFGARNGHAAPWRRDWAGLVWHRCVRADTPQFIDAAAARSILVRSDITPDLKTIAKQADSSQYGICRLQTPPQRSSYSW